MLIPDVSECTVMVELSDDLADVVDHPSHYTQGRFEAIDVIADALTPEMLEGFCIGNVLKYVLRYRHKNGVEDLRKARWYLDRAITLVDVGEENQ